MVTGLKTQSPGFLVGGYMNIYFLRHGETEQNVKVAYYGSLDSELNKRGMIQGERTKQFLKDIKFGKVFISERKRTLQTCNQIFNEDPISYNVDSRINEINFGVFEGKTYEEIGQLYPEDQKLWQENWKEFCPTRGESFIMFYNRVKSFMEHLIELKEENILVVTHGGVIRAAYCYILNENLDLYWRFSSKNGDISLIKYINGDMFIDSIVHLV
jgi:alpha-ribazole phosphatase